MFYEKAVLKVSKNLQEKYHLLQSFFNKVMEQMPAISLKERVGRNKLFLHLLLKLALPPLLIMTMYQKFLTFLPNALSGNHSILIFFLAFYKDIEKSFE